MISLVYHHLTNYGLVAISREICISAFRILSLASKWPTHYNLTANTQLANHDSDERPRGLLHSYNPEIQQEQFFETTNTRITKQASEQQL
jgi:hypothetical protein